MKKITHKKSNKKNNGYTLVEALVVMIVLITVGGLIFSVLYTTLRGTVKTDTVNNLTQNGDYTMSLMTNLIRNAQNFGGVSNNGITYQPGCVAPIVGSGTPTPSPASYKYIKLNNFDGGTTVFSCTGSSIASNSAILIDTTNINLTACSFTCSQNSLFAPPTIGISFTMDSKNGGNTGATQTFNETVSMRNSPNQ